MYVSLSLSLFYCINSGIAKASADLLDDSFSDLQDNDNSDEEGISLYHSFVYSY